MSLRVAMVIERADVALGGAERSVFELSQALSSEGVSVEILAAKGQLKTNRVRILCGYARGKRVRFSTFASALREHLRNHPYEIVHSVLPMGFADVYQPRGGTYAESIERNSASYPTRWLQGYKRLTSFANVRRRVLLGQERSLCRESGGPVVAALSDYVAAQFERHYGLCGDRVVVIRNGVHTDGRANVAEADGLRGEMLSELGLKESDAPVLFLFAAHNFRLKGLRSLILALSESRRIAGGSSICVVVLGGGRAGKYRHLARKLGVEKRVAFLGPVRHIQSALSVTDAAVLPTYYDPSSRFILEALAAGKPVITTRFNGATDLFTDNRHGRIIEGPERIGELAEAMVYFSDRGNIERASRAIAEDNLKESISVARAARELVSLYESILTKRAKK